MEIVRKWISRQEPFVFENSKIPVCLSKLSPVEINALSFACFVFCRETLSKTTLRHETIHYHQQLELLFVGFWALYVFFYLRGLARYFNGEKAYRNNPFEREAYDNERKIKYLERRQLWAWRDYM